MAVVLSPESTIVASREQVSSTIGNEAVVLSLSSGTYFGLNEVGARIWSLIQEPRTVGEVATILVAEYDVPGDRCARDLHGILGELIGAGLAEVRDALP